MSDWASIACDLAAVVILTFVLYFPRHRRRDLIPAYLGLNIGVLAVTQALTSAEVNTGVGLGLFGVLSIIRLRSIELNQQEVAYYFVSLALGVLGGIPISPSWLAPTLMGALLASIFVGDHPRLFSRHHVQELTLDHAYTDAPSLRRHLEQLLGGHLHRVTVRRVDFVNDTTQVEVRYAIADHATTFPPRRRDGDAQQVAP